MERGFPRVLAMLPNRGNAALVRSALLACAVMALLPTAVEACPTLTREQELNRKREVARFLSETDLKVRGTFTEPPQAALPEGETEPRRSGIVTTADGRRFRIRLYEEDFYWCSGFPNRSVYNGDRGLFYLSHSDDPIPEDLPDGVIAEYTLIHFRSGRGK
jgi:hypothetical protein